MMDKSQTSKASARSSSEQRAPKQGTPKQRTPKKAPEAEVETEKHEPAEEAEAEKGKAPGEDEEEESERDEAEDEAEDEESDEDDEAESPAPRVKKVASKAAEPKQQPRGRFRDLLGVVVCVVVVLFARASLADHYVVPTGSMEPTVAIDDRVVVAKASYGLRVPLTDFWLVRWTGPHRGDVVVLESPEPGNTILLKRVVGLPGDTIEVHGGEITINGTHMNVEGGIEDLAGKHHMVWLTENGGRDFPNSSSPTGKLPPNKYLVMGDNRGNSKDGRYFGLVDEDVILGHAVRIYWSGDPAKSWFEHFSWKPL